MGEKNHDTSDVEIQRRLRAVVNALQTPIHSDFIQEDGLSLGCVPGSSSCMGRYVQVRGCYGPQSLEYYALDVAWSLDVLVYILHQWPCLLPGSLALTIIHTFLQEVLPFR